MKKILSVFLFFFATLLAFSQDIKWTHHQLDSMFVEQWNKPEYLRANTADDECYLTQNEKDVFRYLNLVRINPSLFAQTYLAYFDGMPDYIKGQNFDEQKQSLVNELLQMQSLPLLYPDKSVYEQTKCFAQESGVLGKIDNDRQNTSCDNQFAECCAYNISDGLFLVLELLIDAGNGNFAHREMCLDDYGVLGVAIQPHETKQTIAVVNFGFKPDLIYKHNGYEGFLSLSGEKQGKGTYTFSNGDVYEGEWSRNAMNGFGIYSYANGNRYEGFWVGGKRKGQGALTYANGDKYIGEWEDSQMHGQGTYFFATGKKNVGVWDKGKRSK